MKKIILFLSLAFFLVAGFVAVAKIQKANASTSEINIVDSNENFSTFAVADDQDDGKKKKSKDAKVTKENPKKEKCNETKCLEKGKKSCCDKKRSCNKDKDGK